MASTQNRTEPLFASFEDWKNWAENHDVEKSWFMNVTYDTFKLLYVLYPNAFVQSEKEEMQFSKATMCMGASGTPSMDWMRKLSVKEVFVQNKIGSCMTSNPAFNDDKDFEQCKIVAVELLPTLNSSIEELCVVPESVDTIFVRRGVRELVIEGNPHNVFLHEKPDKLKINAPLKQVNADNIVRLYKETFDKDRERYVFNVPELCEENSRIPGYIRATLAFRDGVEVYDEITEINTRFIVSMSSVEITHRDHPVVGTRVHMASNGIERHQTLVVYEPMEMIAEKIARAVIQKQ